MAKEEAPSLDSLAFAEGRPFGEGLRAAREQLGVSLDDVSDSTKVRRQYLQALEDMDLSKLPSRPFTEGYLRAYARTLGLDENKAVIRLRREWPLEDGALPEPVGVPDEGDPRIAVIATAGILVIVAIVVWNIAQRAMADREPPPSAAIARVPAKLKMPAVGAPVDLGQPLPPPVEATLPPPYITPGLEPDGPPAPPPPGALIAAPGANEPVRYLQVRGKIYGAPPEQSLVTLQAVNPVFVILRRGEAVLEIQELKTGEAYRAPMGAGLAIDVTAPSALEVYVAGQYKGRLTQSLNQISALSR